MKGYQHYRAVLLTLPTRIILEFLSMLCGVIAFSYFASIGCDPLAAGDTSDSNQGLPYFVMKVLHHPGVPGLFVACVFCGALSNLSSAINGATAITFEDILSHKLDQWSEPKRVTLSKALTFLFGMISMGVGFLMARIGGTMMQINAISMSVSCAPGLICFILGALVPRVNSKSVLAGSLLSMVLAALISGGSMLMKSHQEHMPLTATNCTSVSTQLNGSQWLVSSTEAYNEHDFYSSSDWNEMTNLTTPLPTSDSSELSWILGISPYLQVPVIVIIGMVVSILLSFIPGFHSVGRSKPHLYYPCIRRFYRKDAYALEEYVMVNKEPLT